MTWLFRLRPALAVMLVWLLISVGALLGPLIAVLVLVGWATLVVVRFASRASDLRRRRLTFAAFVATILVHGVVGPMVIMPVDGPPAEALIPVVATIAFFAPLYVFWSAARVVVELEAGRRVEWTRCIGTFLLFSLMPIGIFLLQHRLRQLVTAETKAVPAR